MLLSLVGGNDETAGYHGALHFLLPPELLAVLLAGLIPAISVAADAGGKDSPVPPAALNVPTSTNTATATPSATLRDHLRQKLEEHARTPAPVSPLETPDDHQRLAPGDRVSFRVIEDRAEPKLLLVADSGELEVPYVGRIMARDRTCHELAVELKQKLEQKYYYRATVVLSVDLLNRTRGSVYIAGEIRATGSQGIPSDETLTLGKAIIRAGGFTDFADKRRVRVTRQTAGQTNQVFIVDIASALEKGKMDKDLKLEAGDIVYVPTRLVNF